MPGVNSAKTCSAYFELLMAAEAVIPAARAVALTAGTSPSLSQPLVSLLSVWRLVGPLRTRRLGEGGVSLVGIG